MLGKVRVFVAALMLVVSMVTLTGCAAAWFLAGAGTAAGVAAIASSSNDDEVIK